MRAQEEYQLAKAVSTYLKLQYPGIIFRFDMAGLNLSKTQAGMNKAIQHSRAYPDLFIAKPKFYLGRQWGGMYLELKKEGTKIYKNNSEFSSPHIAEQYEVLQKLTDAGYFSFFAIGFNSAKINIDYYLKGDF